MFILDMLRGGQINFRKRGTEKIRDQSGGDCFETPTFSMQISFMVEKLFASCGSVGSSRLCTAETSLEHNLPHKLSSELCPFPKWMTTENLISYAIRKFCDAQSISGLKYILMTAHLFLPEPTLRKLG
jgi:hypothetical protein